MKLQSLPLGEWTPDTGLLTGAAEIKGCIPLSGRYAPLPDLQPIRLDAVLNDACLGGFSCYSTAGVANAFVGDRARLYRIINKFPTDVSQAGGYTASTDSIWSFEQFGDNVIAAARGVNLLQRYQLGSSSVFADIPASPLADCVFRIRQHLFACQGTTVNVSAFNNITDWVPSTTTQAFQNQLSQANGIIQCGIGGEQGAIFQERGIVRVTYTGAAAPFNFDEIEGGRGSCSPHAVAAWGRGAFVAAEDGFYWWDGLQATPIGENKVDRYFTNKLNYPYRSRVWAAIDAQRKCVMFGFPTGGALTCNEVLIFSWAENKWTRDEFESQHGFELHKSGVSADDSAEIIRLFGTQDVDNAALASTSVDSSVWRESRKQWCVVNGGRVINQFTGPNRAAELNTGVQEPQPGRKVYVSEVWPSTDAPFASVTSQIETRLKRLEEAPVLADQSIMNEEGFCEVRAEGRFMSATVLIGASATWTEVNGVSVNGQITGSR